MTKKNPKPIFIYYKVNCAVNYSVSMFVYITYFCNPFGLFSSLDLLTFRNIKHNKLCCNFKFTSKQYVYDTFCHTKYISSYGKPHTKKKKLFIKHASQTTKFGGGELCLIHTNFSEFVAIKFSFCLIFYWFVQTKNKNLYSLNCLKRQNL